MAGKQLQLMRVYGNVEPELVGEPFEATDRALHGALVAHLRDEPYSDEDELFFLTLQDGRPGGVSSFSGGYMEDVRKEVEDWTRHQEV